MTLFFLFFTVMGILRLAFWIYAASDMPNPLSMDAFKAFGIGLQFDARLAAIFIFPLALILSVPILAKKLGLIAKPVTVIYAFLFFILLGIYAVDFGFYAYLKSRVSSLVFELLHDFSEAFGMVSQSYPLPLIIMGIGSGTAICAGLFFRIIQMPCQPSQRRSRRIAGWLSGFIFFALVLYSPANNGPFPLRWIHAYFTTSPAITALALNPVHFLLYDTQGKEMKGFSPQAARAAYPAMADFLHVDQYNEANLNYLRFFEAKNGQNPILPLPNVIVIIMESLAYPQTSFAPGQSDPTPHLKALGEESYVFHRFFANARLMPRGVFSTITGIPDINMGRNASRNPQLVDQRVIANEFADYEKYYMIGGNSAWAGISSILSQNIDNLQILEGAYWKALRVDVWGVDDYNLFKEAAALFNERDPSRPFLAIIQTSSYHAPYTVPETPGFEEITATVEELFNYGFNNQKEYNAMRFADYAVGEFFRWAKNSDYYRNSIFFILGDHGQAISGRNMPIGYSASDLAPWHVPLIIHASPELGLIAPGKSLMPSSQVDVFPTAAGLVGIAYNNWTMGRNLFDKRYDNSRIAYISDGGIRDPIRLVCGKYCYLNDRVGHHSLFNITDDTIAELSMQEQSLFLELQKWAEDMEATIRYMLFNNKKMSQQ